VSAATVAPNPLAFTCSASPRDASQIEINAHLNKAPILLRLFTMVGR
jgi:hypothetical protein